jgi:TrmH family RNA methyltransferase
MKDIQSSVNPRIKSAKRVSAGKSTTDCIIEGKRLFREALESGIEIKEVFVTPAGKSDVGLTDSNNFEVFLVPDSLMAEISPLETPPGILAVAKRKVQPAITLDRGFAAFAWSIRDPGNFGTIIRSAEATGCRFLACSADTVDAYSSKVIRASMGSVLRVPIFTVPDPEQYLSGQRKNNIQLCGLAPREGANLFEALIPEPSMIVIGGETTGLPDTISLDYKFNIPMAGTVESLNVGVAASIAFYHFMNTLTAKQS